MFREQIDAILEAETEAKRRLAEAEQQAQALVAKTKAERAHTLEQCREEARRRAGELVERERAATQGERDQLLADTRAQIASAGPVPVADTFVQRAAGSIAGLAP